MMDRRSAGASGVKACSGRVLLPPQLCSCRRPASRRRQQAAALPCLVRCRASGAALHAVAAATATAASQGTASSAGSSNTRSSSRSSSLLSCSGRWRRKTAVVAALRRRREEFLNGGAAAEAGGDDDNEDEGYDMVIDEDEGEDEDGDEDEDEDQEVVAALGRSVVQIRTLHRVPNFSRPWEDGHDSESTSSGFVVAAEVVPEPGALPQRQLLLMTTAGAVEHARKVEVCRAADDATPYIAAVAAVCLDLDVALLRVEDPAFWGLHDSGGGGGGSGGRRSGASRGRVGRGRTGQARSGAHVGGGNGDSSNSRGTGLVPLQLDAGLPHLRKPLVVAGFPLGGGSLCVTSGVVSRIEVLEYSHSGRALLALQVDAPLNNGGWGGPALCASTGRCVGMAFQKFTSQTWMERYDEAAAEIFGGDGDEEDVEGGGSGDGEEGDGGEGGGSAPGQEYEEDAENIGYLVPAQLLQLVLDDYSRELSHQRASTSAPSAATTSGSEGGSGSGAAGAAGSRRAAAARGGGARSSSRGVSGGGAAAGGSSVESRMSAAPLYLDGRPRLGLRYQRMESPALRRSLGMTAGESGILVTGVDPTGSAAGVVQVHDVLLAVAGRQVANDGTTLLQPGQRVLFGHWAAVARVGEPLALRVLRGRSRLELSVRLRGAGEPFLPVSLGPGRRPQYLVMGPLVFTAFSLPYWYELMAFQQRLTARAAKRQLHSALVPVIGALEWGLPVGDDGEEVVLLTEVLSVGAVGEDDLEGQEGSSDEAGEQSDSGSSSGESGGDARDDRKERDREAGGGVAGEAAAWSELVRFPGRLATVNGQRVRNLSQLAAAVVAAASSAADGNGQQSMHLSLEPAAGGTASGGAATGPGVRAGGRLLVLDATRLAADTRAVLRHHSMAAAMSADLRRRLSTTWPFEASHQSAGASRQRRQQGRRVALSGRR